MARASLALAESVEAETAYVDGVPGVSADPSRLEQVLGGTYRIERLIARGGMGSVYEATHLRLDQKCALKILEHHTARNQEAYARFRQEAEIAASLRHPSIVQAFDFNTDDLGNPYMVMELVDGVTLGDQLGGRQLSIEEIAALFLPICQALDAAHRAGIVHRDLKPSNIMVHAGRGAPMTKLLDFGISKMRDAEDGMTRDDVVMGTPNYMAPEQALGKASKVDARTDIFSLGAILYEALTGRRAFTASGTAALLHAIVYEKPQAIEELRPDVPRKLSKVVRRCLAKRPSKRYRSVSELVAALSEAMAPEPEPTVAVTPPPPPPATPRRWPWVLAWALSMGAVGSVAAVASGAGSSDPPPPVAAVPEDTRPAEPPAFEQPTPATYDDALAGASARMLAVGPALYRADGRGLTYWHDPEAKPRSRALPSPAAVSALAASRDGEILVGQADGTVSRWDRELREPFWHMRFGKHPIVAVATDDHYFAVASESSVRLVNARTGRTLRRFGGSEPAVALLFTRGPDERLVVVRPSRVEVIDADGRRLLGSVALAARALRGGIDDEAPGQPPRISIDFLQGDWTVRRDYALQERRSDKHPRLEALGAERQ